LAVLIAYIGAGVLKPIQIDGEEQIEQIDKLHVFVFVIFGSLMLMAIFYFRNKMLVIMSLMILIGNFGALCTCS
jgi:hypothetical protein